MYTDYGYMEEGRLGKVYDFRLISRLGGFLKPYRGLMALSLFFVLIMAGLDLLIPYMTKEAIDRYIIHSAREVTLRSRGSAESHGGASPTLQERGIVEERFLDRYGKDLIAMNEKGRFLLPPGVLRAVDPREANRLEKAGILTGRKYYLFPVRSPEEREVIKRYPSLFERSGDSVFISFDRLKELRREDLLVVRGGDIKGVLMIAGIVVLILILNFSLNFVQVYAMELAGQRMMHDLRMKTFTHLQGLSLSFFDQNPVGRLVTRLTNDIQNVHEMFTSASINLLKDVLLLVGIIIILLSFNRELSMISFLVLPVIFITTFFFSRQARDAFREIRFKIAQMNAFLQEVLSGIRVVQLFRREKENCRRFSQINEGHYLANMKQISVYALFVPLVEVLSSATIGFLLWYGGGEVIREAITLGALVAFLAYMRMFFQPIRDLSEKYNVLQSAMASLERIFSLLDSNQKVSESSAPGKGEIRGNIEFDRVSFSYNGEEKVLKEISFSVREGETVAIVGATGAGKTSLLHLLERFYDGEDGTILVDGVPIRERDISHLRSHIGMVMQDTFLFAGDIEENILLGDREKDGDRVREVARLVNAEQFIRRLPEGYRTKVGEGGEELSAGERQLLAFARALYRNPTVLILDEATSHVDPETERLIQQGLETLLKGRTAIVIAHRLSTIEHADRILVLHKGRIREAGTHLELMAGKGLYYRLYQLQCQSH
jgi:ATP-binding cassette, subfamily B, multidrug efflux pump